MIVILLLIPLVCLAFACAGYQVGRTVEYFACQRDRDRREP